MTAMSALRFDVITAAEPDEIEAIRGLFAEYALWLKHGLCFEQFNEELDELPGWYASPLGALLLARHEGRDAGCVAVRQQSAGACEMKRLFVRPEFRGKGLGGRLARLAIQHARAAGFATIRLDTLPQMQGAISLYRSLGFTEIAPYHGGCPGALFMELPLTPAPH